MPIYEYRCGKCGGRVEVLVRSSTTAPVCPDCGGAVMDKLFSTPNVLSGRTRRPAGHTCCGQGVHKAPDRVCCQAYYATQGYQPA